MLKKKHIKKKKRKNIIRPSLELGFVVLTMKVIFLHNPKETHYFVVRPSL